VSPEPWPDPKVVAGLRQLTDAEVAARDHGALLALEDEINKHLVHFRALLQGQMAVAADLKPGDSSKAVTVLGFAASVGGLVVAVATGGMGFLFWAGLATAVGGAGAGAHGVNGMQAQERKIWLWKQKNLALAATVSDLEGALDRVRKALGKA
jgi:hypothetical protein